MTLAALSGPEVVGGVALAALFGLAILRGALRLDRREALTEPDGSYELQAGDGREWEPAGDPGSASGSVSPYDWEEDWAWDETA